MADQRTEKRRKRLGAYYTPLDLSLALSEWSIRTSRDHVFEPGFGGCEFLFAAYQRLQKLGAPRAIQQLFGCDVDPDAFTALSARFGLKHINGRYLKRDFLSLKAEDYSVKRFDVVIGNPPYVSHHVMSNKQIEAGQQAGVPTLASSIPRRASLWAYFVTHGISFLKIGGRAAWVLPSSFLYADYAKPVRDQLARSFTRVIALRVSERVFVDDHVSEQSIIVLCEGKQDAQSAPCSIEVASVADVGELRSVVKLLDSDNWQGTSFQSGYPDTYLTEECRTIIRKIEQHLPVAQLSSFIDVRIGLVTGANRFFVINESAARESELPESVLRPIVAGAEDLIGMSVTARDLNVARKSDEKCLLVDTSRQARLAKATKRYLQTFDQGKRKTNATFSKREPWHRVNDKRVPDAFFSYMTHHGPRMAINSARTTSINAVHRVFRKSQTDDVMLKELAISAASTFTQVSAELCGRAYGDGVLKLELGELRKIQVIRSMNPDRKSIESIFKQVDNLYRNKRVNDAQSIADEYLTDAIPKDTRANYLRVLSQTLALLRQARTPRYK